MTQVPEGFPKLTKETRPWKCRRNDPTCTRAKPCAADLGARNRRKGLRKQRMPLRQIEDFTGEKIGKFATQTSNEENWRGPVRVEVKCGAQVKAIATKYLAARAQAEQAHAQGDPRPFAFAAVPDGWPQGAFLWVLHSEDLAAFLEAFTEYPATAPDARAVRAEDT